jgi:hypothetical protein
VVDGSGNTHEVNPVPGFDLHRLPPEGIATISHLECFKTDQQAASRRIGPDRQNRKWRHWPSTGVDPDICVLPVGNEDQPDICVGVRQSNGWFVHPPALAGN